MPQRPRQEFGDARSVLEALREIRGKPWPLLAGPVVRQEGATICVDLAMATRAFLDLSAPIDGGEAANRRARVFELAVQRAVDKSNWRASDDVRSLRGKTLRAAGQKLTDIDALGEQGGTLLLISCKSIIYRPELDAGTHQCVRNAAETRASMRPLLTSGARQSTHSRAPPRSMFSATAFRPRTATAAS